MEFSPEVISDINSQKLYFKYFLQLNKIGEKLKLKRVSNGCNLIEKSFSKENDKNVVCSESYVTYRIGTAQKILHYLVQAKKPVSFREMGCSMRASDFDETIEELVDENLVTEISSKNGKCYIISFKGRSRSVPTLFLSKREECP